ncbi:hypothetical protein [Actinophytocola gossypii]|uniref:PPE family domain-containing protein n=1 Tax=Actinophytocola gossypii TaxID=2812003 RepID=A0ABT2JDV5_9PSEU|nr:hypothetical protein [Actinophytocola gossypii]MCT2585896.1 hypothetical protein [Actinophytocola gossypii]
MLDYTKIDLETQLAHIASELPSAALLSQKAAMWTQAGSSLSSAAQSFGSSTRNLAPDWQDQVGERWLESAEASQRTLTTWDQNVNGNNPSPDLEAVAGAIPPTHETVLRFKKIADQLKPLASNPLVGGAIQAILLQLQQAAGAIMNKLAKDYAAAGEKVAAAGSGTQWQGIQGGGVGATAQSGSFAGGGGALPPGADNAALTSLFAKGAAGAELSATGGESGVDSAGESGESGVDAEEAPVVESMSPELSGGGGLAPAAMPPVSPPPAAPPVAPPATAGPAGVPIAPVVGAAVARGAARGGGAVRMPSVPPARIGPTAIPVAAPPVSPLTAPAAAAAPVIPQPLATPAPAAVTGTAGVGAVPPMMPMMGAAALGAGGSATDAGIGAGLARRPVRRPDDEDTPTPGLPAMLSGKAGVPDPFAAAVRQRTSAGHDAPATVEFLDEDQEVRR